ncbi:MAG: hypothetical protein FWD57_15395, partial [Polyangiaceae bacterium]|nr:hypothetical protein [Polyangiaceae bacterium]
LELLAEDGFDSFASGQEHGACEAGLLGGEAGGWVRPARGNMREFRELMGGALRPSLVRRRATGSGMSEAASVSCPPLLAARSEQRAR